jgi:hypothetical protein
MLFVCQVDQALKKLDENIMENRNRTGLLKRELKKLKLQVSKFSISDVKK